ncbi:MAG: hypothetical protein HZB39_10205 [Planctomycetes bacterium]|nr:hypothetical protein [Planctomycetota bacterium]
MIRVRSIHLVTGVAVLCGLARAQSGDGGVPSVREPSVPGTVVQLPSRGAVVTARPTAAVEDPSAWLVPIHTQDADPVGGDYGWWTAGLTFKASFHDGFVFYPFLGDRHERNLPLRWTTESISIGDEVVLLGDAKSEHRRSAWRYEYRYGAATEAYEVRKDGIEQLFVIHERPAHGGDLVVTGRIDSELVGPRDAQAAAHRRLTFSGADGAALVHYGEATAIDANGDRVAVATSYADGRVQLTVDGAWLQTASWPITVDPLTSRAVISTWGGATFGLASYPEVGRDDVALTANVMTFYSRQFSATDFDGYARLTNDDFSSTLLVFTDVTTSWSTGRAGVCFVGGASRWALCLERDFPATGANTVRVRVYTHDSGDTTPNSGTLSFHDPAGGETNRYPSIGGVPGFYTGNQALLAYQADVTATKANTANSMVYGVLFDASTNTFGGRFDVDTIGGSDDCELPDVTQESSGGATSWITVYQRYDNSIAGDDWDVQANRVDPSGGVATSWFMGPASGVPTHKRTPAVGGRGGRYLVAMLRSNASTGVGSEIVVERFDWPDTASSPTKLGPKTILSDAVSPDFAIGGVAYDSNTDSHWALAYQRGSYTIGDTFVARLGFSGGITEVATLYSGPNGSWSPNVAFNDDAYEFLCVYGSNDNPPGDLPVYGQRFQYDPAALNVSYGTACGTGLISATRQPRAGDEFYTLRFSGMPDGTLVGILLCGAPGALPLGFIGMTGCILNVDSTSLIISSSGTVSGGAYLFNLPLFDSPVVIGDLFSVFAYVSPGLNPAGLGVTRGLRTQIR